MEALSSSSLSGEFPLRDFQLLAHATSDIRLDSHKLTAKVANTFLVIGVD